MSEEVWVWTRNSTYWLYLQLSVVLTERYNSYYYFF